MTYTTGKSLYEIYFMLAPNKVEHTRQVYNGLDLIGDLGGVYEIIFTFFKLFIAPFSQFNFILKAL